MAWFNTITPSSRMERVLLFGSVALLPFENYVSLGGGFSVLYVAFGALILYALILRQRELAAVLFQPVFFAAYVVFSTCLVVETLHWNASYGEIGRFGQMIAAGIAIAALCRDRSAAWAVVIGMLTAGAYLSVLMLGTSYDRLLHASAATFSEASSLRAEAFSGFVLADNVNRMSFLAAVAAALALQLGLKASRPLHTALAYAVALVCALGTLLPMSRGGLTTLVILTAFVAATSGVARPKVVLTMGASALLIAMLAPGAIFSRFSLTEEQGVPEDARVKIYSAAVTYLPAYWPYGLGEGNFNGWWGRQSVFWNGVRTIGPHNCFIEMTMFWGAPGLLSFVTLLWFVYRALDARPRADPLSASLTIIVLSLLCWMMFVGELYHKEFAVGLGIAGAAKRWRVTARPVSVARAA